MPTGSWRHALSPDGHRGAIAARLMKASLVVDGNPAKPRPLDLELS
jgi:hypothetical protein